MIPSTGLQLRLGYRYVTVESFTSTGLLVLLRRSWGRWAEGDVHSRVRDHDRGPVTAVQRPASSRFAPTGQYDDPEGPKSRMLEEDDDMSGRGVTRIGWKTRAKVGKRLRLPRAWSSVRSEEPDRE